MSFPQSISSTVSPNTTKPRTKLLCLCQDNAMNYKRDITQTLKKPGSHSEIIWEHEKEKETTQHVSKSLLKSCNIAIKFIVPIKTTKFIIERLETVLIQA